MYIRLIDMATEIFSSLSSEAEFQYTYSAEFLTPAVQRPPAEQVSFGFLHSQWGEMGTIKVHVTFWDVRNSSTVD